MQSQAYIQDQFQSQFDFQVRSIRTIFIAAFVCSILLVAGMWAIPETNTPLMAKIIALMSPTLMAGAAGSYAGRNLRGWLPLIGLTILAIVGMFLISALGGDFLATAVLIGWGFVLGMIIGPLVAFALEDMGPQVVVQAFVGTTAVMMGAGVIVFATGINFSFLMPLLFLGLMGLIVVSLIGIFVRFSRTVNLTYSIFGMIIFAGYFLFGLFRVSQSENTWARATQLTIQLYLDFVNFFIYLLRFLMASRRR